MGFCQWIGDESPVKLENTSAPVKSVGNSTTNAQDMETDEDVRIVLYILAESVKRGKTWENGFRCRTVESASGIRSVSFLQTGKAPKCEQHY